MKGKKPNLQNVVPMKDDIQKPVPDAPEFLEDEARKVWNALAPELVRKDRLDALYAYQFASYCTCVANFIAASACLALEGLYYETKTRNGVQQKKRAAWGIQQEAMAGMRRDSALFGLSPVDALRLSGEGQGDLFDDAMKMLNGTD